MAGQTRSLGTIQRIAQSTAAGTSLIIGTTPIILYTCPVGKKAQINNAAFAGTSYGAGTYIRMRIAGVITREATAIETQQINSLPGGTLVLVAGQKVELVGDSAANNESAEYTVTYQELPI